MFLFIYLFDNVTSINSQVNIHFLHKSNVTFCKITCLIYPCRKMKDSKNSLLCDGEMLDLNDI